ncbi:hypothetical protein CPB84DRAFT_1748262 [Gymnopilus junonius]|uniref:Uncharacterized protein n=1 Tax=Gymnopilus junonius TaxID=109634 RepID=A0A9P5NKK3_GYMJU|nr:hypothetical protein CPB84DRAFT_1748262 [Gymnopilus junonius]
MSKKREINLITDLKVILSLDYLIAVGKKEWRKWWRNGEIMLHIVPDSERGRSRTRQQRTGAWEYLVGGDDIPEGGLTGVKVLVNGKTSLLRPVGFIKTLCNKSLLALAVSILLWGILSATQAIYHVG